jgi:glycosyltransferase involved in cell wall biosynthesis
MLPPQLSWEQVNCGPDWTDETGADGQVRSLATPVGEYDLAALASRLPPEQQPEAVVCLVDSSWRNLPRNLAAFKCPRVLLVADTHHQTSPIVGMLRYAVSEPFDRIVFLYDRHHLNFFASAGLRNLYWYPGLTFPFGDREVRAARKAKRVPQIAFAGQSGRIHARRGQLLEKLVESGVPLMAKALPQQAGLNLYGASLIGFNASLNGDLNLRVFEILATGATLLTDRLAPDSGQTQIWREGQEILTYGSAGELAEMVRVGLDHPQVTAAIGRAGAAWFDEKFSLEQRRANFLRLVHDGIEVPEFALPGTLPPRVYFAGDTDRLIDTLTVYEGIQELHRVSETVQVELTAEVPADIAEMCATLPRVAISRAPGAEEADVAVFDRNNSHIPVARCLWCWNADGTETERLAGVLGSHGFAKISGQVALFGRVLAPLEPAVERVDERRHVLIFTDDPDSGGVAQYNHSLALGLLAAGFRVTCAQSHSHSPLIQQQRAAGVEHHWIPFDTKKDFPRTLEDAAGASQCFAAVRPDFIVFSDCCPFSNFAAREVALLTGVPFMVVIGFVGAYLADRFSHLIGPLAAQYAAAREVVAVSQENLELLRRHFGLPEDRGVVIHYGRPESYFAPRDEAVRRRLRTGLKLPANAVVGFTAARLSAVKGHVFQIAALRQLADSPRYHRLHLVWAGDGEQRGELEQAIRAAGLSGRIHLLGQRWDVAEWLDAADFFVLPSELEGMPLAIMEAMAKGLPVAATAVSGIPEELGETGRLLPAGQKDRAGLLRELTAVFADWTLHADRRRQLGADAHQRAQRLFREELMISRTVELLQPHLFAGAPAALTA